MKNNMTIKITNDLADLNLTEYQLKRIDTIKGIISRNRLITDRKAALLLNGISCKEIACGTGGVGTIRNNKHGLTVHISYGWTKNNYAIVAII
jgi:hypothetical protein